MVEAAPCRLEGLAAFHEIEKNPGLALPQQAREDATLGGQPLLEVESRVAQHLVGALPRLVRLEPRAGLRVAAGLEGARDRTEVRVGPVVQIHALGGKAILGTERAILRPGVGRQAVVGVVRHQQIGQPRLAAGRRPGQHGPKHEYAPHEHQV